MAVYRHQASGMVVGCGLVFSVVVVDFCFLVSVVVVVVVGWFNWMVWWWFLFYFIRWCFSGGGLWFSWVVVFLFF